MAKLNFLDLNLIKICSVSTRFYLLIMFGCLSMGVNGATVNVQSQQEFNLAHDQASAGDTIEWLNGIYEDVFMEITKDHLYISSEDLGGTIFTGASRVDISSDFITLIGFQYLGGDIGTRDVINTRGSHNVLTQINIRGYQCYKYLRVREESQFVTISHCNFENRINLDDQNILSILVDENTPGYHKIQHCSFKNFSGTGNDLGIEPIRIGLSTQADHISRTTVEYCYFSQCNGDGELISSKASQNVYRHNTFENNPLAELVLRHGSEAIVYGNFFLNGKGGVRVREGQNHYIYNNYFYRISDRVIFLQNEESDPLDNINVAFNTIIDCSEMILGGDGGNRPTNVTIANNIFTKPDDKIFVEATGTETWINNIVFGDLGIPLPAIGISNIDPLLVINPQGFYELSSDGPAIDGAIAGYKFLPTFGDIDNIDLNIDFDIMKQNRPEEIEEKDIGCSEFPHSVQVTPFATEENTGPSYNTSTSTNVEEQFDSQKLVSVYPNPANSQLNIHINHTLINSVSIHIFNVNGQLVEYINASNIKGLPHTITRNIQDWPAGIYSLKASVNQGGKQKTKTIRFIKSI